MRVLGHNKVCELEDFSDPELVAIVGEVFSHERDRYGIEFPKGREYRKYWEIGMTVRALRHCGKLVPASLVLGVGAGTEATIFYLTRFVQLVFATDMYLEPGSWGAYAPKRLLTSPEDFAPYPFDRQRLVLQHMDGCRLRYPDGLFDAIFSSGSIEHFGGLMEAASAAYEMGRVLKPGGVLTLSTEYRIAGPSEGLGMEGTMFLTRESIMKYIVGASGLMPLDAPNFSVSDQTLKTEYPREKFVRDLEWQAASHGATPRVGEVEWSVYPHIVLSHPPYLFGSIHLTLVKTQDYPCAENGWARPSPAAEAESVAASSPQPVAVRYRAHRRLAIRLLQGLLRRVQ